MKSLQEYIIESEQWMENPAVGDDFAINIREDCLIESYIIAVEQDRLTIAADQKLVDILESYGYQVVEEGKMKNLDIEHQDYKSMTPRQFERAYNMKKADWFEKHRELVDKKHGKSNQDDLDEAEYQGREVKLGKKMAGDVKKYKVYVRDPKTGNVKKVNFGDKTMRIKKSNPARRKSFRARHNCANPGSRLKARYWSCRNW